MTHNMQCHTSKRGVRCFRRSLDVIVYTSLGRTLRPPPVLPSLGTSSVFTGRPPWGGLARPRQDLEPQRPALRPPVPPALVQPLLSARVPARPRPAPLRPVVLQALAASQQPAGSHRRMAAVCPARAKRLAPILETTADPHRVQWHRTARPAPPGPTEANPSGRLFRIVVRPPRCDS